MFTEPNTKGREKQVDELLNDVRRRLVEGDFVSISLTYDIRDVDDDTLGLRAHEPTGSFTLRAESRLR